MASIAIASFSSDLAFQALLASLRSPQYQDEFMTLKLIEDEHGRFKIWCGSLGALQTGPSSLDARLRESAVMRSAIIDNLGELQETLNLSSQVVSGTRLPLELQSPPAPPSDDDDDSDSDVESESSFTPHELQIHLTTIQETVRDLYKLSFKIRNVSTRKAASLRPSVYTEVDPDTKIDTFTAYLEHDRRRISDFLTQARRDVVQRIHEVDGGDATHASEYPSEDDFLIQRLQVTIGKRRRMLRYWQRHARKLAHGPLPDLMAQGSTQLMTTPSLLPPGSALPGKFQMSSQTEIYAPTVTERTVLSLTEATKYVSTINELLDTQSVVSYATTSFSGHVADIEPPPPPAAALKGQDFVCPYCGILCPARYGKDRAWRYHIIQDLQPYICTYEYCEDGDHLYSSRREWQEHERAFHRQVWQCFKHASAKFTDRSALQQHLQAQHDHEATERQIESLLEESKASVVDNRSQCPFCNSFGPFERSLEEHMAAHMERLATFAISRALDEEGEGDVPEDQSDRAQRQGSMTSFGSAALSFESHPDDAHSNEGEVGSNENWEMHTFPSPVPLASFHQKDASSPEAESESSLSVYTRTGLLALRQHWLSLASDLDGSFIIHAEVSERVPCLKLHYLFVAEALSIYKYELEVRGFTYPETGLKQIAEKDGKLRNACTRFFEAKLVDRIDDWNNLLDGIKSHIETLMELIRQKQLRHASIPLTALVTPPPHYLSLPAGEITAQDAVSWLGLRITGSAYDAWLQIFNDSAVSGTNFTDMESHLRFRVQQDDYGRDLFGDGQFLRTWTSFAHLSTCLDTDFSSLRRYKSQEYLHQIKAILALPAFPMFPWTGAGDRVDKFRILCGRLYGVIDAITKKDPTSETSFWEDVRRCHSNLAFGVIFIEGHSSQLVYCVGDMDFIAFGLNLICRALDRDAVVLSNHLATTMPSRAKERLRKAVMRLIVGTQVLKMREKWLPRLAQYRHYTFTCRSPEASKVYVVDTLGGPTMFNLCYTDGIYERTVLIPKFQDTRYKFMINNVLTVDVDEPNEINAAGDRENIIRAMPQTSNSQGPIDGRSNTTENELSERTESSDTAKVNPLFAFLKTAAINDDNDSETETGHGERETPSATNPIKTPSDELRTDISPSSTLSQTNPASPGRSSAPLPVPQPLRYAEPPDMTSERGVVVKMEEQEGTPDGAGLPRVERTIRIKRPAAEDSSASDGSRSDGSRRHESVVSEAWYDALGPKVHIDPDESYDIKIGNQRVNITPNDGHTVDVFVGGKRETSYHSTRVSTRAGGSTLVRQSSSMSQRVTTRRGSAVIHQGELQSPLDVKGPFGVRRASPGAARYRYPILDDDVSDSTEVRPERGATEEREEHRPGGSHVRARSASPSRRPDLMVVGGKRETPYPLISGFTNTDGSKLGDRSSQLDEQPLDGTSGHRSEEDIMIRRERDTYTDDAFNDMTRLAKQHEAQILAKPSSMRSSRQGQDTIPTRWPRYQDERDVARILGGRRHSDGLQAPLGEAQFSPERHGIEPASATGSGLFRLPLDLSYPLPIQQANELEREQARQFLQLQNERDREAKNNMTTEADLAELGFGPPATASRRSSGSSSGGVDSRGIDASDAPQTTTESEAPRGNATMQAASSAFGSLVQSVKNVFGS